MQILRQTLSFPSQSCIWVFFVCFSIHSRFAFTSVAPTKVFLRFFFGFFWSVFLFFLIVLYAVFLCYAPFCLATFRGHKHVRVAIAVSAFWYFIFSPPHILTHMALHWEKPGRLPVLGLVLWKSLALCFGQTNGGPLWIRIIPPRN